MIRNVTSCGLVSIYQITKSHVPEGLRLNDSNTTENNISNERRFKQIYALMVVVVVVVIGGDDGWR
jgi:hypothetical protein